MASLSDAQGTYIYDAVVRDLNDKTSSADPCGYRAWLGGLLPYLINHFHLHGKRVLDVGCGAGELTTMMNMLGYDAVGLDVHERALSLARTLARENGIPPGRFVLVRGSKLPFPDASFDIVTMISCLEHMGDEALSALVPELRRVCRGVIFIQVPSPMKISDDHTGLRFVPWMPGWMARPYIALRGRRYRYAISESGTWDVVYRTLRQIRRRFAGLEMELIPPLHSFPACDASSAVLNIRKTVSIGAIQFELRIPLLHRRLARRLGAQLENFYPYYNVVFKT